MLFSFDFTHSSRLWTIRKEEDGYHDLLIISSEDKTMILKTGESLKEVKDHQLFNRGLTIHIEKIKAGFVQVYNTGFRVLNFDCTLIKSLTVASNKNMQFWIQYGIVCDPYIVLLKEDKSILIYYFDYETKSIKPLTNIPDIQVFFRLYV